jgi:hypothetical protein
MGTRRTPLPAQCIPSDGYGKPLPRSCNRRTILYRCGSHSRPATLPIRQIASRGPDAEWRPGSCQRRVSTPGGQRVHETLLEASPHSSLVSRCAATYIYTTVCICNSRAMCSMSRIVPTLGTSSRIRRSALWAAHALLESELRAKRVAVSTRRITVTSMDVPRPLVSVRSGLRANDSKAHRI